MRTAEFDAFGPWVMQVVSPEGLPRLYQGHPIDFDTARMILKVPRDIPRRDANPEMHLYDHLLVAGESALTVLTRREDEYDAVELPYARIAAVHTSVVILDGLLQLHDVEGTAPDGVALAVRYNGVSDDVVGELARILRAQALATAAPRALVRPQGEPLHLGLDDLGRQDVALVTTTRELATTEGLMVWSAHRRLGVQRRGNALAVAFAGLVFPPTVHAAIIGTTSGEVHLVHRRPWVTTGRKPVHSVAHTVICAPRTDRVEVVEHPRYAGTQLVRVISGRSVVEMPMPTGAPTAETLLTLLGTRVP